jgi:hypothetical protein
MIAHETIIQILLTSGEGMVIGMTHHINTLFQGLSLRDSCCFARYCQFESFVRAGQQEELRDFDARYCPIEFQYCELLLLAHITGRFFNVSFRESCVKQVGVGC